MEEKIWTVYIWSGSKWLLREFAEDETEEVEELLVTYSYVLINPVNIPTENPKNWSKAYHVSLRKSMIEKLY